MHYIIIVLPIKHVVAVIQKGIYLLSYILVQTTLSFDKCKDSLRCLILILKKD